MASLTSIHDLGIWLTLGAEEQNETITALSRHLGDAYSLGFTRSYTQDKAFRVPTFLHRPSGLEFNLIIGGTFSMGLSPQEQQRVLADYQDIEPEELFADTMRPVHRVQVRPFLLTRFPITAAFAWRHLDLRSNVIRANNRPDEPVAMELTREEALMLASIFGFDLPSEAQWEYACRGNTRTPFYFGASLPSDEVLVSEVFLHDFSDQQRCLRAANPFGLVGLLGLGEWCSDTYRDDYKDALNDDRPVLGRAPYVVRGGGAMLWPWQGCGEWAFCMSAHRFPSDAVSKDPRQAAWTVRLAKRLEGIE